jgi:hypothetical protein
MTQVRRDSRFKANFGRRLSELVEEHLQISWETLSDRLQYANSTTVRQAGRGNALLSAEKLALLAGITNQEGRRVSVDWLLTGLGPALCLEPAGQDEIAPLAQRVAQAPRSVQAKISGFLEILASAKPGG